jgi:hypothetical protein
MKTIRALTACALAAGLTLAGSLCAEGDSNSGNGSESGGTTGPGATTGPGGMMGPGGIVGPGGMMGPGGSLEESCGCRECPSKGAPGKFSGHAAALERAAPHCAGGAGAAHQSHEAAVGRAGGLYPGVERPLWRAYGPAETQSRRGSVPPKMRC